MTPSKIRGKMIAVGVDREWGRIYPGSSEPEITWWWCEGKKRQLVSCVYEVIVRDGVVTIANVMVN